mmetsp:Transcript_68366/g.198146  ORF Transcript_68366/g.198146 Transcript_68366/m.198146 type:complete len:275 (+) Transcript_68366:80-904(+)
MEALSFVPNQPVVSYILAGSLLVGVPVFAKTISSAGGPLLTRLASVHGLTLVLALSLLSLQKGNSLFIWHVIGMGVAVLALQPAALHAILSKHSAKDPEKRKSKVMEHKLLQISVLGCVVAGFLAIFLNKPAGFPGKHFQSVHSLVGLFAIALMGFNMLHAAYRQGNPIAPKLLWVSVLHRTVGTLAFSASLVAVILGLFNRTVVVDWATKPVQFHRPQDWYVMSGWAKNTHGDAKAWMFIGGTGMLLGMMMLTTPQRPRSAPVAEEAAGTKAD